LEKRGHLIFFLFHPFYALGKVKGKDIKILLKINKLYRLNPGYKLAQLEKFKCGYKFI
jgi:hypothetical protein